MFAEIDVIFHSLKICSYNNLPLNPDIINQRLENNNSPCRLRDPCNMLPQVRSTRPLALMIFSPTPYRDLATDQPWQLIIMVVLGL